MKVLTTRDIIESEYPDEGWEDRKWVPLDKVEKFVESVEWVIEDACFAAPEAYDRHMRNYEALHAALKEYKGE